MSARDFFCCCRSSVIRHFPLSSQGRNCEKNQILAVFQKQAIFPKFKIFRQNECTRFFLASSVVAVVVVISLFRHRDGPVKKIKFSPFFKNKQSFQNSRFLGKMSVRDFFGVVGLRRRRSSVISLFRHRDGPVKKMKFSPFFKNKQSFQNSRFLGKMSARDFFCCCRSSVIRHFPLSSQGRTCEKNQILAVFQKQAIFPKFKIFRQNECTRFFRRRRSSLSSVVRHFPLSSQGQTCEKNQIFAVFQKQAIFPRFLGKMSAQDFFGVVGRRRGRSSIISLFRHRDGPVKKIKFSPFFKNKQSFQNSRFLVKMSVRVFFSVVGRRRRRSSVISLFRHRDGPVKKIKFSPFFKNKRSFQNSRFLGKMSAQDFFCCCRSSVIRHFPLSSQGRTCEKNQILAVFQKQAIFPKFKIFRQNECTRFFLLLSVVGHPSFPSFLTGTDL